MTIWLLAILLLAGVAGVGYTQGAIRAGISFFGIIIAALLAGPLAKLVKPAVVAVGVSSPVLQWILPPFIVFVIILALIKVGAMALHKKVDVYYRYKAGDLRFALFDRLNSRLGACIGLLNGVLYLILISWVIFAFSYWTIQLASPEGDSKLVRLLNQLGRDTQRTGMAKVARAIDPLPPVFYKMGDLAGLLYQNSLLEARLSRYPAFLALAERPEYQSIAQDKGFAELRAQRKPIREVLDNPGVSGILHNPDQLKTTWDTVATNLDDLTAYLTNGISAKYSDKIIGRWFFDVNASMMIYRKTKSNLPSSEMQKIKATIAGLYSKTTLVVTPDEKLVLKNLPKGPGATENLEGTWSNAGADYQLALGSAGVRRGKIEGGRLILAGGEGIPFVFAPED